MTKKRKKKPKEKPKRKVGDPYGNNPFFNRTG